MFKGNGSKYDDFGRLKWTLAIKDQNSDANLFHLGKKSQIIHLRLI